MSGAYAPPARPVKLGPPPDKPVPEQLAFDFTLSPGARHRLPDTSRLPQSPNGKVEPPDLRG